MRDFLLPILCKYEVRSSVILHCVDRQLATYVPGQSVDR